MKKEIIISAIIFATILLLGISILFWQAGFLGKYNYKHQVEGWKEQSNNNLEQLVECLNEQYQKETEYCYFQSTFGDVVKEKELDCDRYKDYPFNTIHWDSLPHGFIK